LIAQGKDAVYVSEQLGHADAAITYRHTRICSTDPSASDKRQQSSMRRTDAFSATLPSGRDDESAPTDQGRVPSLWEQL
jgi:hypothetical protein